MTVTLFLRVALFSAVCLAARQNFADHQYWHGAVAVLAAIALPVITYTEWRMNKL